MPKQILLGNEAIVKGALSAGIDFVSGYPGCPAAEVGDIFAKIGKEKGVYCEISSNEKTGLEAAIGASFSGLKSLVNMKNFGLNVCLDSLLPLAYTGTKAGMVIMAGDDPSCWSSAQSEENTRGFSYLSHIPMLEPADPQECYDFTKLAFEISEKFSIPVILRTTTRVSHQKMPVEFEEAENRQFKKGEFIKNYKKFVTLPPRVLEMKKELLEKIKKISAYAEKSKINEIVGHRMSHNSKLGIITSGISYLHVMESLEQLELGLPVLKLGFFYPLPEKKISQFISNFKNVLVVEEMDPYLEKELVIVAKTANPKLKIFGKDLLTEIGELDSQKITSALSKILKIKNPNIRNLNLEIPRRTAKLCFDCPYWNVLPVIKKLAPQNAVFGGDIGCYMIAGFPPHDMQDYLFSMGSSLGIGHGVSKSTNQKVITLIGDGTFFHSGISPLINAVYNKSDVLMIVLDNRITAMTGHQNNPGMGKTGSGDSAKELKIEEIAKACGADNVKTLEEVTPQSFESAFKEFIDKPGVSVIVCKRICAIVRKRQERK